MVLSEFTPSPSLTEFVRVYRVVHFVFDDISTLFILAFRLGAAYVKLNVHNNINIDFMEFQDPINELSQIVYELTNHIIKNKLMKGIE